MRVFDSNILIYHLNDALPPEMSPSVATWISEGAVISVMTRIEVLGYPQTADQLEQAMHLLSYFDEMPLSEPNSPCCMPFQRPSPQAPGGELPHAECKTAFVWPRSGRQGRKSWRVKVPLPSVARFGR